MLVRRVLVTGAGGQIGSELVPFLRERYGAENVMATDLRPLPEPLVQGGPYRRVDCLSPEEVREAARDHGADTVYHLAAILSAAAEAEPGRAYRVNVDGLLHVLDEARERECSVFVPSSVAVFGPTSPRDPAPQDAVQRPSTMYGVTKVAGELICEYYHSRYGLDTRGLRLPGIVSYVAPPGGGTTDYAVDIFRSALEGRRYTCFLGPDTRLDFLYMPDAIRGAVELMEADSERLRHRNAFNITAVQVTPQGLAEAIRAHIPGFGIEYEIDPVRQAIADSWPRRLDDSSARDEWGWAPEYDLERMVAEMLEKLAEKSSEDRRYGHAP